MNIDDFTYEELENHFLNISRMGKINLIKKNENNIDLQYIAIEYDPSLIYYIKYPVEEVQFLAYEKNHSLLKQMKCVCEELQFEILGNFPEDFHNIFLPTEKAVKIAKLQGIKIEQSKINSWKIAWKYNYKG